MNITMFTHTHSNSSTSPSQGSRSNFGQSSTNLQSCQKSTRGDTTGKTTTTSPATQPNVTVANQFTVKLQRAPKASRKNTCNSIVYHSCRAIPNFIPRKQTQHLQTNQLHHADEQICLLADEWSSRPQHYLESTSRSSIESSGEPPSKVLHSGV
jgi:hypothetical protein